MLLPSSLILFFFLTATTEATKPKRQIYREQVLPSSGGKIPDGAFATDRLALNRLNKAGISIPDGVLLEHRHAFSHPHSNRHDPEDEDSLVKIVQKPEDRFVASVGAYHNDKPLTVSSTYIIRKPTHSTNIRTPDQQMPLHEILASKHGIFAGVYPSGGDVYSTGGVFPSGTVYPTGLIYPTSFAPSQSEASWRPFRFEETVPPPSPPPPKQSVAYYPITVPFELPNKKAVRGPYSQGGSIRYTEPEDVHKLVDWPYILGEYTRLADEINSINGRGLYAQSQAQHSLFFTPEVVAPLDSYYYGEKERYARKSKEISFTDHTTDSADRLKTSKVIKLRCTLGRAENAVDGHDTKCRLRY